MRIFRGYVARKLLDKPTFFGTPRTVQHLYELTKAKAGAMIPFMKDKPIVAEHNDNEIGKVVNSYMDGDDWTVEFGIDEATPSGRLVCGLIDNGMFNNLSLKHIFETNEPIHVAVCWKGAREGTHIHSEMTAKDDTKPELYKQAGEGLRTPITVSASSHHLVELTKTMSMNNNNSQIVNSDPSNGNMTIMRGVNPQQQSFQFLTQPSIPLQPQPSIDQQFAQQGILSPQQLLFIQQQMQQQQQQQQPQKGVQQQQQQLSAQQQLSGMVNPQQGDSTLQQQITQQLQQQLQQHMQTQQQPAPTATDPSSSSSSSSSSAAAGSTQGQGQEPAGEEEDSLTRVGLTKLLVNSLPNKEEKTAIVDSYAKIRTENQRLKEENSKLRKNEVDLKENWADITVNLFRQVLGPARVKQFEHNFAESLKQGADATLNALVPTMVEASSAMLALYKQNPALAQMTRPEDQQQALATAMPQQQGIVDPDLAARMAMIEKLFPSSRSAAAVPSSVSASANDRMALESRQPQGGVKRGREAANMGEVGALMSTKAGWEMNLPSETQRILHAYKHERAPETFSLKQVLRPEQIEVYNKRKTNGETGNSDPSDLSFVRNLPPL
jgi:hypothetical protein